MAWIESHQSLGHHPKTLRLAAELKCGLPCAVGYLHFLWWWALDYADDGLVSRALHAGAIAGACAWRATPDRFIDALVTCGFVEETDEADVLRIHDWMDYAGKLKEQRTLRRESNRKAQQKRRQQKVSAESAVTKNGVSSLPNQPDTTVPDRTGPPTPHPVIADIETRCPTAPHTFTGSYAEHLENDPRHKVKVHA